MSKITVTTIAGLTSGGDANTVKIESGDDFVVDTNVLKVDASNNRVGIGTASPSSTLELNKGSAGTLATFTDGVNSNFVIETTSLLTTIGNTAGSTSLAFKSSNSEKMRILSSGGITFNGDTAAANALDDYEEGTWTPSFSATSPPTVTYNSQVGNYTKVGRMVMVNFYLVTGSVSGGSGDLKIAGLPFAVNGPAGSRTGNAQHWNSGINSNSSIGGYGSGTEIILAQNNNDRVQVSDLRTSNDSNQLWWSFSYITNA